MKLLKKLAALSAVAAVMLCGSACSFSLMSAENNTADSISKTHMSSTETDSRKITVGEGEDVTVSFNIITNDGTVDIDLTNADGESFYEGREVPTSSFEVELTETGEYTLSGATKGHSGSINISWETHEE